MWLRSGTICVMAHLVTNSLLQEGEKYLIRGAGLPGPRAVVDAAKLLYLRGEKAATL